MSASEKDDSPAAEGEPPSTDHNQPVKCKTAADLQKMRLERLMRNPARPVLIPEKRKEKQFRPPPEFVRDVMGSSAGAGSGEFHVYRALRRREYSREEFLEKQGAREDKDVEWEQKLEENKRLAEEKTAKKRAKRERAKQKLKLKKMKKTKKEGGKEGEEEDDESEEEEGGDGEEEDEPHFVIGGK